MPLPSRLILGFFSAYALNIVLHELAHAVAAHELGIRATAYHYFSNIDLAAAGARRRIIIAAAGPFFSLGFGLACWLAHRATPVTRSCPLPVYGAVFGISIFLGNLVSTAFAGDFGTVASLLSLGTTTRRAMTGAGLVLLPAFMFAVGMGLSPWAPRKAGRAGMVTEIIEVPVVVGMALVIPAFLPLPTAFILSWAVTSVFWIFAAAGLLLGVRRSHERDGPRLLARWADYAIAIAALASLRILVHGIALEP